MNGKDALFQVSYDENLKARVLLTVDGTILLDTFVEKELGPLKINDVTIEMIESSLSKFHPSCCLCTSRQAALIACTLC